MVRCRPLVSFAYCRHHIPRQSKHYLGNINPEKILFKILIMEMPRILVFLVLGNHLLRRSFTNNVRYRLQMSTNDSHQQCQRYTKVKGKSLPWHEGRHAHIHHPQPSHACHAEVFVNACVGLPQLAHLDRSTHMPHANPIPLYIFLESGEDTLA